MPMKNPTLEKKIQDIEKDEKKRRSRAARFAAQKHKREGDSRRQVIARIINKAKQETKPARQAHTPSVVDGDFINDCGAEGTTAWTIQD
ncbi:uncharacterized protein TRAVEDRAFT_54803 [Trametes versicolor FP-101664 SS1]|uniref:Uncharacterized protein n=1 Tax=Trametes versicolor (strain FP-101664) TaxID=717944 RepID=R7S6J3_TRAVS|nr:uncharacterized protein TRAVEDRAFT_54803 [Trametes versicolor FP-101664 SS1]EIW51185.1 hypothetical protein TRAVEDRAFT_54803 [Trametes versicolor FP-101664 SS1]